jgi:hypothetical protein
MRHQLRQLHTAAKENSAYAHGTDRRLTFVGGLSYAQSAELLLTSKPQKFLLIAKKA